MTFITQALTDHRENEMQDCLRSGSDRHFSKLYDDYSAALFGLIHKWIKDAQVAENLLQDAFIKAWRCRDLYDPAKGKIFTWLYNITRNICIDHLRSRAYKRSRLSVLSGEILDRIAAGYQDKLSPNTIGPNTIGPNMIGPDTIGPDTIGLRKLVNRLRSEEKEVIELMYFKGFTQREIAILMDTPLGTVKTRISRGIRNLRRYFQTDWKHGTTAILLN